MKAYQRLQRVIMALQTFCLELIYWTKPRIISDPSVFQRFSVFEVVSQRI